MSLEVPSATCTADSEPQLPAGLTGSPGTRGRASWSGLLRLSLVTVPIKAYPAVSTSETVHFNQLHADCGQRISYQKHCPIHGQVDAGAIVRGFQYAPAQYVVIEPEELEPLRPAKEKALLLEQFIEPAQLDPVLFSGRTLYLVPDGMAARRPYQVLAEALRQRSKWALGGVALSGNRPLVLVRPAGRLLAMDVLHFPAQVRNRLALESDLLDATSSKEELQLAGLLIDAASGAPDWPRYRDDTSEKIRALVAAKVEGRPIAAQPDEPLQILQLLDALKQSVAAAKPGNDNCAVEANAKPQTTKRPGRRRCA